LPEAQGLHSQVAQAIGGRLYKAFQNFFRRVKNGETPGYPRFKGYDRYTSFVYPQSGFKLSGTNLKLSKLGEFEVKIHRELKGKIKTCQINRVGKKYYVTFVTELELPEISRPLNSVVGCDLGCKTFLTLSDGTTFDKPKDYLKFEKLYSKVDSRISRETNRVVKRKLINRRQNIFSKIKNKRDDFIHKASKELLSKYDVVVLEKLSTKKMVENSPGRALTKSILDCSFSKFINVISYKAEEAGKKVILINPRNTSKMCSSCYTLKDITLSDRVYKCDHCGLILDRDLNASINILRLGMQSLETLGLFLEAPTITPCV
jgi:putative transposase